MIPFSELSRFKAPIGRPSAKTGQCCFFGKKCAIFADFCPELCVVIDRLSPFLADQSASKGSLQVQAVQNDLSSIRTLCEEILPGLFIRTLFKSLTLRSSFHF